MDGWYIIIIILLVVIILGFCLLSLIPRNLDVNSFINSHINQLYKPLIQYKNQIYNTIYPSNKQEFNQESELNNNMTNIIPINQNLYWDEQIAQCNKEDGTINDIVNSFAKPNSSKIVLY